MIKFGVVITTYQRNDGNTPFYLKRALDSVFKQKYNNFKVFVIGDKYENNNEFESIFNEYPKEKIYYENLPFAYERDSLNDKWLIWKYAGCFANNYGITKSLIDGYDYICHLDHDDEWYDNHLLSLNDAIIETNSPWLCTKSEYTDNIILPRINSDSNLIEFYPVAEGLIHSSTCINFKQIPIRHRNVYYETGISGLPGDADLWSRISNYLKFTNQTGILVNKITCKHVEEGYERNM